MNTTTLSPVASGATTDADYHAFLQRVNARFLANIKDEPLFETLALDLWSVYLDSFPDPEQRQHHNCHCCRNFIERFGTLATIDANGRVESAVWHEDDASELYRPAVAALRKAVQRANVAGVFLASERTWGTPVTGAWQHLSLRPPAAILHKRSVLTAGQVMAEKREDFKTVMHALNEFTQPHLETALTLLRTESLYRSEKVLGQAEWLYNLHVARAAARGLSRANVVWRAIATAPAGFCHPRSSMIGTLLEDIAAGKDYGDVAKAFAAKMNPLQYQRPQAAPSTGAIAAAEKVVAQLNAAGALARRFCRLDEVLALWKPTPHAEPVNQGVFGHLAPKTAKPVAMRIPAQTMSWDKFQRTVLPTAERMQMQAPIRGGYCALVTAVNSAAPPIIQWDCEELRNPVSWYFWAGGAQAASFGLQAGSFVDVDAITLQPSMWHSGHEHQGAGVMFVLAGAHETANPGAALFPEILRAEFHGVRSVIESYSRASSIQGKSEPHAAGIMLKKGDASWSATVRVWANGSSLDYQLDRWD